MNCFPFFLLFNFVSQIRIYCANMIVICYLQQIQFSHLYVCELPEHVISSIRQNEITELASFNPIYPGLMVRGSLSGWGRGPAQLKCFTGPF